MAQPAELFEVVIIPFELIFSFQENLILYQAQETLAEHLYQCWRAFYGLPFV